MIKKFNKEETELYGAEGYIIRCFLWNKDREVEIEKQFFIEESDYERTSDEVLAQITRKIIEYGANQQTERSNPQQEQI